MHDVHGVHDMYVCVHIHECMHSRYIHTYMYLAIKKYEIIIKKYLLFLKRESRCLYAHSNQILKSRTTSVSSAFHLHQNVENDDDLPFLKRDHRHLCSLLSRPTVVARPVAPPFAMTGRLSYS